MFAAWADPAQKQRWSDCHAETGTTDYSLDFRPGGREIHRAVLSDGRTQLLEKTFIEIVPDARIIFAYGIAAEGRALSASLVTVEFHAQGAGTQLRLTEQLAYLDGHMDLDERRRGTDEGLDRLQRDVEGWTASRSNRSILCVMAGLVAEVAYTRLRALILWKSGGPDFRCHPRLARLKYRKTWMPGTRPGMTECCRYTGNR